MAESHSLGQKGEDLAADYLKKAGYKIRHRNWVYGKKELDIIAENNEFIVFVEVKTRNVNFSLSPASAVTAEKQRSVIYAADAYVRIFNTGKENRFDIITVVSGEETTEIDHIENAFYPTLR